MCITAYYYPLYRPLTLYNYWLYTQVARELLSSGADPALRDKHGQRADDLTSNHEARRLVSHLVYCIHFYIY
jgi:hypothetical protein